ncbi:hypothetical protein J056_000999 [Wallemia ichthyophaga EXF-994]|uniref:Uncharacterized protein n=1 Tax=Wallemia ichthyophaga (strain EXF-994 / CBS 113033) TaxID=1299270 RepID=R9AD84_WALI9|nr:uncharacterized protein J056_000999 [Wallemia ichthyophaga EXF-994]EOR00113.1 hypothetical protein J056_000999 [Wallemia ichthyophaga EXF-994]
MEQALEKFKVEARDTLRECLHEQQHNLAKYLKETTLALEQQIQELKEQNVEPQIMPAAPSYAQKAAAETPTPVLSDNYIKPADTKRIMDEHIAKTFDDRLHITENFISTAKRLPTKSFKLQAQDSKIAMELRKLMDAV